MYALSVGLPVLLASSPGARDRFVPSSGLAQTGVPAAPT